MADGRRVQPGCPQAAGHGRRRAARRWRDPWGAWMCGCDFHGHAMECRAAGWRAAEADADADADPVACATGRSRRFRSVHIALSLQRLPWNLTLDQLFYRDTINPEFWFSSVGTDQYTTTLQQKSSLPWIEWCYLCCRRGRILVSIMMLAPRVQRALKPPPTPQ